MSRFTAATYPFTVTICRGWLQPRSGGVPWQKEFELVRLYIAGVADIDRVEALIERSVCPGRVKMLTPKSWNLPLGGWQRIASRAATEVGSIYLAVGEAPGQTLRFGLGRWALPSGSGCHVGAARSAGSGEPVAGCDPGMLPLNWDFPDTEAGRLTKPLCVKCGPWSAEGIDLYHPGDGGNVCRGWGELREPGPCRRRRPDLRGAINFAVHAKNAFATFNVGQRGTKWYSAPPIGNDQRVRSAVHNLPDFPLPN